MSSSVIPFSSCLQSFPASGSFPMSQFFSSGGQSIRASAFCLSPSNEYSGLISFIMDWLDLLAVQGTLKNLLQHHSSKVSILWRSALFLTRASLVAHLVKNLPARRDTWVQSLSWEDPLRKETATLPCILAWRIPWTVYSMRSQGVG